MRPASGGGKRRRQQQQRQQRRQRSKIVYNLQNEPEISCKWFKIEVVDDFECARKLLTWGYAELEPPKT